jgi:hypothetical protein
MIPYYQLLSLPLFQDVIFIHVPGQQQQLFLKAWLPGLPGPRLAVWSLPPRQAA